MIAFVETQFADANHYPVPGSALLVFRLKLIDVRSAKNIRFWRWIRAAPVAMATCSGEYIPYRFGAQETVDLREVVDVPCR